MKKYMHFSDFLTNIAVLTLTYESSSGSGVDCDLLYRSLNLMACLTRGLIKLEGSLNLKAR